MPRFNATTFDAKTLRLDDGWTPNQLGAIATLLKNKAQAVRRSATEYLDDSVIPDLAEDDATYRNFDREARRLEQQYEGVKAKLFLIVPRPHDPTPDDTVRLRISEAKLQHDRLAIALRDVTEYKAAVQGASSAAEAAHHARHIAVLEIRQVAAWRCYQCALLQLGARPAFDARVVAARKLVKAENNMARLYARGGMPDAVFECDAELDNAVKEWKEATVAMRNIGQRQAAPLPNATEAQKLIATQEFRAWCPKGRAAVLSNALDRGVYLTDYMDVWKKAVQCVAVPDLEDSLPEKEEARSSSASARPTQAENSWSVLDASSGSDATVSQASTLQSRSSSQCVGQVSQHISGSSATNASSASRAPTLRYGYAPRSAMRSLHSSRDSARQFNDSEDSEMDFCFAPARGDTSTPNREESADATLGSIASVLPPAHAEQGAVSFFDSTSTAPAAHVDYVSVHDATPRDAAPTVEWENRTGHFAPVRRGTSQGGFANFIEGLGFRIDRASRFQCAIAQSRKVQGRADEYHAIVTFVSSAEAARCIRYINAQRRDFGMTDMGDHGAWRMLTAQWSTNEHYNGKADAHHEAALRREYRR